MTAEGMHIGATCVDEHEILSAANALMPGGNGSERISSVAGSSPRRRLDPGYRRGRARRDTPLQPQSGLSSDIVHTAESHNISPLSRC